MRILVDESLLTYGLAGAYSGFQMSRHNPAVTPTFDTFDMVNPDVYIANADQINETVLKNIEERPALRLCIVEKYGNPSIENPTFTKLKKRLGNIYSWIIDNGCADIISYSKPEFKDKYRSDLVCIEDTPIKGIEDIVIPDNYIFKLFSASIVNHNRFCGFLDYKDRKHAYKSSKFSIAAYDNIYNSIICDSYPISFGSDIVEELNTDKSVELKELKEKIISSMTNFHALIDVFNSLDMTSESKIVENKMKELL